MITFRVTVLRSSCCSCRFRIPYSDGNKPTRNKLPITFTVRGPPRSSKAPQNTDMEPSPFLPARGCNNDWLVGWVHRLFLLLPHRRGEPVDRYVQVMVNTQTHFSLSSSSLERKAWGERKINGSQFFDTHETHRFSLRAANEIVCTVTWRQIFFLVLTNQVTSDGLQFISFKLSSLPSWYALSA